MAGETGQIDQRDINRDQSHRINSIILSLNRHPAPLPPRARVPSSGFGAIRQVTINSHQTERGDQAGLCRKDYCSDSLFFV